MKTPSDKSVTFLASVVRTAIKAESDTVFDREIKPRLQTLGMDDPVIDIIRNVFAAGYSAGMFNSLERAGITEVGVTGTAEDKSENLPVADKGSIN